MSDKHLDWLGRLHKSMLVGSYANDSIRNYLQEVRLLFQFHHDKDAEDLTELDINNYSRYREYIKQVHKVGYAKCKMVATHYRSGGTPTGMIVMREKPKNKASPAEF